MNTSTKKFGVAACGALALLAMQASAIQYSFDRFSANSTANATIGEAQLLVDVINATENGVAQVSFKFVNTGPFACSITDIYFMDGTLLGIYAISDSGDGVAFSEGADPAKLPGFQATAKFSADSDPEVQPNGVNPGEWVSITFNLISPQTYADTITALANGSLRIGIHVQGFDGGGSETFTNNGPQVPDAGAASILLGLALLSLEGLRRRLA